MIQYEFKVFDTKGFSAIDIEKTLNENGADGWQFAGSDARHLYLTRVKKG